MDRSYPDLAALNRNIVPQIGPFKVLQRLLGLPNRLRWDDFLATYRVADASTNLEGVLHVTAYPPFVKILQDNLPRLTSIRHPGLEPLLDSGRIDNSFYLLYPLPVAKTLQQSLGKPFEPKITGYIINDLAAILGYLHGRGLVHGAVIPAEIVLADKVILKSACLYDLVRQAEDAFMLEPSSSIDAKIIFLEDSLYNPVETEFGSPATLRSDQYQLALVAYELLAGLHPYRLVKSHREIISYKFQDAFPEPFHYNPNFPKAAWPVLQRALSGTPENRFATVTEFNQAFQQAIFSV